MDSRHASRPLLGISYRVASTFCFAVMAVLVKLASDRYPIGEVVFFRSFFAGLPLLAWMAWLGQLNSVYVTRHVGMHFTRTVVGLISMVCFFAALARLPLADVTAIQFAAPLIIVVLATLMLGETVRFVRGSAVAVGFLGVLVILSDYAGVRSGPTPEASLLGVVLAVIATLFMAGVAILIRQLTRTEPVGTIVFYFFFFSSLIALATAPFGWVVPTAGDLVLLIAIGVAGGIGQILGTHGYAYADASLIAPFEYTSMLWAVTFGYLIFGHLPTPTVMTGAAIVIAAGLIVIFRERQLARARAKTPLPPVTPA